ncbi:hypothetical protein X975_22927, partial [Stegodyphus mimosarum]
MFFPSFVCALRTWECSTWYAQDLTENTETQFYLFNIAAEPSTGFVNVNTLTHLILQPDRHSTCSRVEIVDTFFTTGARKTLL